MTEVSIILPTYNERENLPLIVEKLQKLMDGHSFEIVIVDDNSSDGTWQIGQELASHYANIQLIRRVNRKGLTSAILEGFLLGKGKYVAVTDADMQHDINLLPQMLEVIADYDMVVGSRYVHQTEVPGWDRARLWISRLGTQMACRLLQQNVTDPLSGFFMLHRDLIHQIAPKLHSDGFKILLEILFQCPNLRVKELPYEFGVRLHGSSKLDTKVMLDFLDLLISRSPLSKFGFQFIRYSIIGASGVAIHLLVLYLLYAQWQWPYALSLLIAIQIALASNYVWNNQWTFGEQRFMKSEWWTGLIRYNLACLLGSTYNLAIGWYLVHHGMNWVFASLLGIMVGISWNYMANQAFTWKK